MAMWLRQSTASQEILLGPFVDDTDGKTAETGLTIANTDIKIWKEGGTTESNKNSGGATHIASGRYYAVLDATDTNTLGKLEVSVHVAGALPVRREFMVVPAMIYDSLILGTDRLDANVTHISDTAQTARDIGASVLLSSGTGTGQVTLTSGRVNADITHIAAAAVSTSTAQLGVNVVNLGGSAVSASSGLINANVTQLSGDAVAADNAEAFFDGTGYAGTNNVIPTVTTVTNLHASAATAAELAKVPKSDGTVTWNATALASINAECDTALADYDAPTNAEMVARTLVAADYATATALATVDTVVDSILVDTAEIGAAGAGLTALPWNAAWDAEVQSECADALAVYDPPTNTEMVAAFTEIKGATWSSVTDTLEALRDRGDAAWTTATGFSTHSAADVWAVATRVLTANTNLNDPTAAAIADAVWDEVLSGHLAGGSTGNALNAAGAAGDPWTTALPGAYSAGSAGYIIGTNLNATMSSRASQTSVDTIDGIVDEILVDTGTTLQAELDGIQADTEDIQARLPAALVGGRMDASVGDMAANTLTASALATDAVTEIQSGLATASALSTVAGYVDTEIATLQTSVNDIPTVAEFEARTLAAADYATAAALATVDTVVDAILVDTNELQTDWVNGGRLDTILDARASQSSVDDVPTNAELAAALAAADDAILAAIAALNNLSAAQARAEMVGALTTDTYAEPSAVPPATASLKDKIGWMAAIARNKITQTGDTQTLRNDADNATIATSTISDDTVTSVRGEWS